jgi:hypothetical protein
MKIISIFLLAWITFPALACTTEDNGKLKAFARIIQKDSSGLDIAVFYPKKLKNAELNSVTFNYVKGEEFVLLVNAKISNSTYGLSYVNIKDFSSSYIAVKAEELKYMSISISYSWPPGPDGIFRPCGPIENHKVYELIENV